MPSYLVLAVTVDRKQRRFVYESAEPLAPDAIFPDAELDAFYAVWRLMPDDSGTYDGLVDANQLVGV